MSCYSAVDVGAAVALAVLPGSALANVALNAIRSRLGLQGGGE